MPPYDPSVPTSSDSDANMSAASAPPSSTSNTSFEDDDSMPDLQSISDSSEDEMSDAGAEDIDMPSAQNVINTEEHHDHDDPDLAPIEPINFAPNPNPLRSSTRRPRVEDDHDEDRDRRHPSQRLNRSEENLSSGGGPSQPTPRRLPPFDPRPHVDLLFPRTNARRGEASTSANTDNRRDTPNPPPTPANATSRPRTQSNARNRQQRQQMPPLFGGFAITIDLSTGTPVVVPHGMPRQHTDANAPPAEGQGEQGAPHGNPFAAPGANGRPDFATFADIMARLGMLGAIFGMGGEREQEDPERAKRLVDGLEEVPIGLVRRLERVGGAKDESGGIGDSGCAICWDRLLDGDGQGFGGEKKTEGEGESSGTTATASEQVPPPSASESEAPLEVPKSELTSESTSKQLKIVTLPCAHIFHASCLIPWFSCPGQTTCPTCRFNIDPENLTWQRPRRPTMFRTTTGNRPTQPSQTQAGGTDTNIASAADANPNGAAAPIATHAPINPNLFAQPQATTAGQLDDMPPLIDLSGRNEPSAPLPGFAHQPTAPSAVPPALGSNHAPPAREGQGQGQAGADPLRNANANDGNGNGNRGGRGFMTIGFDVIFGPDPGGIPTARDGQDELGDSADEDEMMNVDIATWERMMDGDGDNVDGEADLNGTGAGAEEENHNHRDPTSTTQGDAANAAAAGGAGPPPDGAAAPPRELPEGHPFRMFQGGFRNMGPGVHVAAGIGRTMGEAFSQLLGGLTGPMPTRGAGGTANPTPPAGATRNPDGTQTQQPAPVPGAAAAGGGVQSPPDGAGRTTGGPTLPPFAHLFPGLGAIRRFGGGAGAGTTTMNANTPGANANAGNTPAPPAAGSPPLSQMFGTFGFPSPAQQQPAQPARTDGANPNPPTQQQPQQGTTLPPFGLFFDNIFSMPPMNRGGPAADPSQLPQAQPHTHTHPHGHPQPQQQPLRPQPPPRQRREPRERKEWVLPPAPGPTLRQRVERKEREAGLRCDDVICGVGPSDEDPFVDVGVGGKGWVHIRRLRGVGEEAETHQDRKEKQEEETVCTHRFHPSCLVTSERVASRGSEPNVEDGEVDVSCPLCREPGVVSVKEWEAGVETL